MAGEGGQRPPPPQPAVAAARSRGQRWRLGSLPACGEGPGCGTDAPHLRALMGLLARVTPAHWWDFGEDYKRYREMDARPVKLCPSITDGDSWFDLEARCCSRGRTLPCSRLKASVEAKGIKAVRSLKTPCGRGGLGRRPKGQQAGCPSREETEPPEESRAGGLPPGPETKRLLPTSREETEPLEYLPCKEETTLFCLADLAPTNV